MAEDAFHSENPDVIWETKLNTKPLFDCMSLRNTSETNKENVPLQQNTDDKKSEEEIRSEIKMEEDENENAEDKEERVFYVSSALTKILKKYPDILKKLHSVLMAKKYLHLAKDFSFTFKSMSFEEDPIKFLDDKDLKTIDHNSSEQSFLKANSKEWENFTLSLQRKFCCVIFNEEDLSVTYVCAITSKSQQIVSEISNFFKQNHNDIKISPHVMDFVKHNEKFSNLELEETAEEEIWIRNIKKTHLEELKKEMGRVDRQSFVVDENQYGLLHETKKKILTNIEMKFHVKGSLYQLSNVGEIPVVFQINPITRISCVEKSDLENIPLDLLIFLHFQEPKEKSSENLLLDIPRNYHIIFLTTSWNKNLQKDLTNIFKDDIFSHTIGIRIPPEISKHLEELCQVILTAVGNLSQNHKRPVYILLFVESSEIQQETVKILKTFAKPDPQSLPEQVIAGSTHEECTVEIIKGLITEQKVDVIVNSAYFNLNLDVGSISSALLKEAGADLQIECGKKYPKGIKFPEIAVTNGYKLPCRYVFHGALPFNDKKPNISTFVEHCLRNAVQLEVSTIAFPFVGTGNLQYPPQEAADQILLAIEEIKQNIPNISLQKIIIVIHPKDEKYIECFKSTSAEQKDLKGAIPKRKPQSSLQNEQKPIVNCIYQQLQWIQFFNYSNKKEMFDSAIKEFDRQLNRIIFTVKFDEVQELFFFYDLIPLVPDIVEQLDLEEDNLVIPKGLVDQLQKYLTELRQKNQTLKFNIPSDMKLTHVKKFLSKIQQRYPRVKFDIDSSGQVILFKALDIDVCNNVKYHLECYFGLKENIPTSQDRLPTNNQDSFESDKSNTVSSSSHFEQERKENHLRSNNFEEDDNSKLIFDKVIHKKKLEDKQVEILSDNFKQDYPQVGFHVRDNGRDFTFWSLDLEINYKVKYQLECYLGLRENIPTSQDQLPTSKQNLNTASSSSHFEQERNENHLRSKNFEEDDNSKLIFDKVILKKKLNDKEVESLLEKIQQDFPNVQFGVSDDGQHITFKSLDWDTNGKIKFQLDIYLGSQKKTLISQDRFNRSNQETIESNKSNIAASSPPKYASSFQDQSKSTASSSLEKERIESAAPSPKKYEYIHCFQTKKGLLVKVYQEDILKVDVDGIVNITDRCLINGKGLPEIIIRAAGNNVHEEGQFKVKSKMLKEGEVLSTSAGNLKQYKNIIHAVGPTNTTDKRCKKTIAEAVSNSLREANRLGLSSIALPSAIFRVPCNHCAVGYFKGVDEYSKEKKSNWPLNEIHFVDIKLYPCKEIKDYFSKKLQEVPIENTSSNFHESKGNSLNIPNPEKPEDTNKKKCPICLETKINFRLLKCTHQFCCDCYEKIDPPYCPICRTPFAIIYGNQPDGTMTVSESLLPLPGFSGTKTYEIMYDIYGFQKIYAYLPKCKEGEVIIKMLQLAFQCRLIFTVGNSIRTDSQNVLTWNEIHHKTNKYGGTKNYGYPDADYLSRVTQELADKGITPDLVANKTMSTYINITGGEVIP